MSADRSMECAASGTRFGNADRALTKQAERSPQPTSMLHLSAVGLRAAAPALTSRAARRALPAALPSTAETRETGMARGPSRYLGMRSLLQVHLPF